MANITGRIRFGTVLCEVCNDFGTDRYPVTKSEDDRWLHSICRQEMEKSG